MINSAAEWREFYKLPGAIATVMDPSWLLEGCPKCECKEWSVTSDCWAYCQSCFKGYPTQFPFTNAPVAYYDQNGAHCLMCKGSGKDNGEICQVCYGVRTQPDEPFTEIAMHDQEK